MVSSFNRRFESAGSVPHHGHWHVGRPRLAVVLAIVLTLGIGLTAKRVMSRYQEPGPFDRSNAGYCDFHNGIYFPSLAMIDGVSPYGGEYPTAYPVERQIPFFSPAVLAVHAPLAMLPLRVAEVAYFGIMLALIGFCCVHSSIAAGWGRRFDVVLLLAVICVYSRAGHATLFSGYFTLELIAGVFVAISQAGRRPWLSAIALVFVSFKPTYILPIGFLMLARGNLRELVYGAMLAIFAAAVPGLWLAWNEGGGDVARGLSEIVTQIGVAQEIHRADPIELPVNAWTRVDLFAVLAKWSGQTPGDAAHLAIMAALILPAMVVLHRRRQAGVDDGLAGVTGAIITATCLSSIYHHAYDLLLLIPPLAGIASLQIQAWTNLSSTKRYALAAMILSVAFNYGSAKFLLDRLSLPTTAVHAVTSVNGVVVFGLMILVCWIGWPRVTSQSEPRRYLVNSGI